MRILPLRIGRVKWPVFGLFWHTCKPLGRRAIVCDRMKQKPKNPHAQALGSLGGLARKNNMSRPKLKAAARHAANARWQQVKEAKQ